MSTNHQTNRLWLYTITGALVFLAWLICQKHQPLQINKAFKGNSFSGFSYSHCHIKKCLQLKSDRATQSSLDPSVMHLGAADLLLVKNSQEERIQLSSASINKTTMLVTGYIAGSDREILVDATDFQKIIY